MKIPETGFEHMHTHSHWSILDGFQTISEGCEAAKKIGSTTFALTDHGSLSGYPELLRETKKFNLSPIFGCEFYYQPNHPSSKSDFDVMNAEDRKKIKKSYHLIGIAKNEKGYKNLIKLSSWSHLVGKYFKPRLNKEILKTYQDNIAWSSCCCSSEMGVALLQEENEDKAEQLVKEYKEMLDDFRMEIMLIDYKLQPDYNKFILKMSDKYGIPVHLTNDVHYATQDCSQYQRKMIMINTRSTIASVEEKLAEDPESDIFELQDSTLFMRSELELNAAWQNKHSYIDFDLFQQSKTNAVKLANDCRGVKIDSTPKLPVIENAEEKLAEALQDGLRMRGVAKSRKYLYRLREEYDLICRKGFCSYFMTLVKIMDEAKRMTPQILGYGSPFDAIIPGRGSGVGSLCLYVLGITDVDPIKHDLLFSRFLSENRGGKSLKLKFSDSQRIN